MIDPASATVRALAARDGWAPLLAFTAGAISSFSPCVAPRILTVSALSAHRSANQAMGIAGVFSAGVVGAYSVLVLGGSLIWQVMKHSGFFYAAMAAVMAGAGAVALSRRSACQGARGTHSPQSLSSTFLLGASSVATLSPCCMPVVAASVLYASTTGPLFAWMTATGFALGHSLPLALASLSSRIVASVANESLESAVGVVAGALALAVSGLFVVLA